MINKVKLQLILRILILLVSVLKGVISRLEKKEKENPEEQPEESSFNEMADISDSLMKLGGIVGYDLEIVEKEIFV